MTQPIASHSSTERMPLLALLRAHVADVEAGRYVSQAADQPSPLESGLQAYADELEKKRLAAETAIDEPSVFEKRVRHRVDKLGAQRMAAIATAEASSISPCGDQTECRPIAIAPQASEAIDGEVPSAPAANQLILLRIAEWRVRAEAIRAESRRIDRLKVLKSWDTGEFSTPGEREAARNRAKQAAYRHRQKAHSQTPLDEMTEDTGSHATDAPIEFAPGARDAAEHRITAWIARDTPQSRQVRPEAVPNIAAALLVWLDACDELDREPSQADFARRIFRATGQGCTRRQAQNHIRRVRSILHAEGFDRTSAGILTGMVASSQNVEG
ncbi:hypothetical protein E8L99_07210 [Phreatobacter aquaticus]|uniref:Uncharacterized protein n=1 Tax=Phreatobacter aquaticus TaxID=2570229 RepID=A0A4D7QC45_9HYPH|nr:hypothetical protein [Phreatobacter aquaticus]QCK85570.1 hypothetical protein E8L99_07210 [Phreatobacter aquaticus]